MPTGVLTISPGVRAYLRELREVQSISQERLGEEVGLTLRAMTDLESGKTEDWKFARLVSALRYLNGSIQDVFELEVDKSDEDAGRKKARMRLDDARLSAAIEALQATEEGRQRLLRAARETPDMD